MAAIKLSQERYQKLIESERLLSEALTELDKAEECGIECQEMRAQYKQAREQIAKLKLHYSP